MEFTMSQSTANDLLNTLGMKAVDVSGTETTGRAESPVSPSSRSNVVIALLAAAVLGTGFKLIGDYACNRAIDAWAAQKQAPLMTPSPEAIAFFEKNANEPEIAEDQTAQEAPVAAEPVSTNTGG